MASCESPTSALMAFCVQPMLVSRSTTNPQILPAEVAIVPVIDPLTQSLVSSEPCAGVGDVCILAGDKQIAVAEFDQNARVKIRSVKDLGVEATWTLGKKRVVAFAQAQVKDVLAAMTADGRLWLWDLRSNEPLADVSISDGDTTAIRFTENDTKLEGVLTDDSKSTSARL